MKTLCTLIFALSGLVCFGQDTGRMETDRPDQTESPFITKKGFVQLEWGLNVEQDNGLTTIVHPTVLWKYGACKKFEFRLITEIISRETPLLIPQGNDVQTGLLPVRLGAKLALWEEKGMLPKTAILAHVAFPTLASKAFQVSRAAPEFRLAMQHTLSQTVGLGYNIGAEFDPETGDPLWIYTIGPGFNLGKNGYAYVELFGDFQENESTHNFDAGFAYYIKDNLKLDISSGINLNDSKQYYVAVGVSFRFKAF
jgi:hypothetical protein